MPTSGKDLPKGNKGMVQCFFRSFEAFVICRCLQCLKLVSSGKPCTACAQGR